MQLDPAWTGLVGAIAGAAIAGTVNIVAAVVQASNLRKQKELERKWKLEDNALESHAEAIKTREDAMLNAVVALSALHLHLKTRKPGHSLSQATAVEAKRAVAAVLMFRNDLPPSATEQLRSVLDTSDDFLASAAFVALDELLQLDPQQLHPAEKGRLQGK